MYGEQELLSPPPLVVKFGGAVLRDVHGFARMLEILQGILGVSNSGLADPTNAATHASSRPVLVVVSALAATTRTLDSIAVLAAKGALAEARQTLSTLLAAHRDIVRTLLANIEQRSSLEELLLQTEVEISRILDGIDVTRQLTPKTLDKVLAYGELLALHITRHVLQTEGIDAGWIDAQRVIVTNTQHTAASPLTENSSVNVRKNLVPLLAKHRCVLIQGFVGATVDGTATTMGKESSTLTATFLAAQLHAAEVRLYTDVQGVCSADPKTMPEAVTHKVLSFEQARIAAHHGLKLLYTTTIEPAEAAGIPVQILNAWSSDGGTKVSGAGLDFAPIIIVRHSDGISEHSERGLGMPGTSTICVVLANTSQVLRSIGLAVDLFPESNTWCVAARPQEHLTEIILPSRDANSVASFLHSRLITTV